MEPSCVIDFWFGDKDRYDPVYEHNPRLWWGASVEVDEEIASRFGELTEQAYQVVANNNVVPSTDAEPFSSWRNSASGCVALILLLDQFPRNIHRGLGKAFATDEAALELVKLSDHCVFQSICFGYMHANFSLLFLSISLSYIKFLRHARCVTQACLMNFLLLKSCL
jgi:uncharacterized protein (DUF924 family)